MLRHSAKSNSRGGAGAGEATAKAKKEALSALCSKNGQGMRRGGREEMKMI